MLPFFTMNLSQLGRGRFATFGAALCVLLPLANAQDTGNANPAPEPIPLEPFEILEVFDAKAEPLLFEQERLRLLAWLTDSDAHALLLSDLAFIHRFNQLPRELGGPLSGRIHWYPWFVNSKGMLPDEGAMRVVSLYDRKRIARALRLPGSHGFYVDLVPVAIDRHRVRTPMFSCFELDDGGRDDGDLIYEVAPPHRAKLRNWSAGLDGRHVLFAMHGEGVGIRKLDSELPHRDGVGSRRGFTPAMVAALLSGKPRILEEVHLERFIGRGIPREPAAKLRFYREMEKECRAYVDTRPDVTTFAELKELADSLDGEGAAPAIASRVGKEITICGAVVLTFARGRTEFELIESKSSIAFGHRPDPRLVIRANSKERFDHWHRLYEVRGRLAVDRDNAMRPLRLVDATVSIAIERRR